ncbi:nucleoside hydrolase [Sphaerisporangium sp. TRM90804]|uniref:nucleoside hydrolase n=1 Tax=Sphaerisporangium sp. TRM90804 TaxID=3031113 RepID=UPI00244890A9|nr:nucleoside hydrolase [Sphaerisporangium sp. TRM90804]MDH2426266.1 nucleoside hydrolase [Sphaerisporangium sp. TRM90804]
MSAVRRVVVDTDAGIDDALALLYLAGHPRAEITAVTSVFGNCAEEDALRNAAYALRLAGVAVPMARGAAGPLAPTGPIGPRSHGRDGLGDRGHARPLPPVAGETAAALLVRLGAEHPGELDLLTLGPLTNLALALRDDPLLLTRYRSVVLMAGSGPRPAPGATPLPRDTNVAGDPAAAREVLGAPGAPVWVGVHVTATATLPESGLPALRGAGTPVARFAAELLESYQGSRGRGGRAALLHDPLAAGVLLDPSLVTAWARGPVDVVGTGASARAVLATAGEPAGTDPRGPAGAVDEPPDAGTRAPAGGREMPAGTGGGQAGTGGEPAGASGGPGGRGRGTAARGARVVASVDVARFVTGFVAGLTGP